MPETPIRGHGKGYDILPDSDGCSKCLMYARERHKLLIRLERWEFVTLVQTESGFTFSLKISLIGLNNIYWLMNANVTTKNMTINLWDWEGNKIAINFI